MTKGEGSPTSLIQSKMKEKASCPSLLEEAKKISAKESEATETATNQNFNAIVSCITYTVCSVSMVLANKVNFSD